MSEHSELLLVASVDVAFRMAHGHAPGCILFSEANPHGFREPVMAFIKDEQFLVTECRVVGDDA